VAGQSNEKAHILIIDDDRSVADILVEFLTNRGHGAAAAYSGAQGLERFRSGSFQMVITDMKMPDMDGLEVLSAVKSIDKNTVVLVITGYATIDSAVEAIKAGAYDFISKPVDLKSLEVIINRALERHTLFRRLGMFRGLTLALIVSVPVWLILGIILAYLIMK
jgi:DNA-binding NtrC family response regulator